MEAGAGRGWQGLGTKQYRQAGKQSGMSGTSTSNISASLSGQDQLIMSTSGSLLA